jgi:transposase-like protein
MPLTQQDLDAIGNRVWSQIIKEYGGQPAWALLGVKATTAEVNAARDALFSAFRSEGISGAADHAVNGTNEILAAIAAIPPCNVQIDINALADRIVAAVGTDLASQVIDALGERIKPTSA